MAEIMSICQTKDGIMVLFDTKYDTTQLLGALEVSKYNILSMAANNNTVNLLVKPRNIQSSPLNKSEKCVDKDTAIKYYMEVWKLVQTRCQKIMATDDDVNAKYYIDETLLTKL